MKRKLALLLAAVMTLSLLPMNVFAATKNDLTKSPTVVPEDTLFYEAGLIGSSNQAGPYVADTTTGVDDPVDYYVDGTDLVIKVQDDVKFGDTIRLELENAVWFFRGPNGITTPQALSNVRVPSVISPRLSLWSGDAKERWGSSRDGSTYSRSGIAGGFTYDTTKGAYGFNGTDNITNKATSGFYFRFPGSYATGANTVGARSTALEVPYALEVSNVSDRYATLTVLGSLTGYNAAGDPVYMNTYSGKPDGTNFYEIRVPIVSRSTEAKDIKVKITDSNLTTVSTGTWLYGIAGGGATNTYVDSPETARDDFGIKKLVVKETRLNSIGNGIFYIIAPSGFEFNNPNATKDGKRIVDLGIENGLHWTTHNGSDGLGDAGSDYLVNYKYAGTPDEDRAILQVTLRNISKSTNISGSVYLTGLSYSSEENTAWGDVMFKIEHDTISDPGVTDQSFKAGTRLDWTITLTTSGDIPNLVNGRYEKDAMITAEDTHHKTAHIIFQENSVNAWWSGRQTVFSLPEGVKFRKVKITDVDNLDEDGDTNTLKGTNGGGGNGVYINDGARHGHVLVDGNTMTWNNLKIALNKDTGKPKKAKIQFDAWVSIQSGFVGDVTLSVAGSAIPEQPGAVAPTLIAKQMSPVTITTKVTDLKIGYQYQKTADIMITETKAGIILKNKQMRVSVSDMVSTDMWFSPDCKVAVTNGDMKIANVSMGEGHSGRTTGGSLMDTSGTITFDVIGASSKVSTLTVSNVSIKIDRTVPESNNRAYKVIAWGAAIAPNYGTNRDEFNIPGIMADYVKVISSANDRSSVLTQEVRVTIGEAYYTVNGITFDMDGAAYISPASNSTMVPLRFVANAFGIRDDQVIWDNAQRTVTIVLPTRVCQFKIGSSTMLLDGSPVTMFSPDHLEVQAEINNERSYVPFRALGEAFGIEVAWDEATQTAIYNPGTNANVATTTTDAATPATTEGATTQTAPATTK